MGLCIAFIGYVVGFFVNCIVNKISDEICLKTNRKRNIVIPVSCGMLFFVFFVKLGLNIIFVKAVVLSCILIIAALIDFRHHIIPDRLVIISTIIGILFLFIGDISLKSGLLGMAAGGGVLFMLALVPGAMGGGDIKLMLALGLFLGLSRTIWALMGAFILASTVSLLLIVLRIKGRKDYIPFGPFLAAGSLISLLYF